MYYQKVFCYFDKYNQHFYVDIKYCSMNENAKILKSKNKRIINGHAVRDDWDWIVRLEFYTSGYGYGQLCGGTVVHRYFVLTAAHCCIGKHFVKMNFKEIK